MTPRSHTLYGEPALLCQHVLDQYAHLERLGRETSRMTAYFVAECHSASEMAGGVGCDSIDIGPQIRTVIRLTEPQLLTDTMNLMRDAGDRDSGATHTRTEKQVVIPSADLE